ncbi:MAG: response regulator, partial [Bacteroidia bacterium]
MQNARILWVDDEIDRLKGHRKFLEQKGFEVNATDNGFDALDLIRENKFDIVFLDEQMPGMDGLTALGEIQKLAPNLPVVMITKSEEEHIMEDAIGAKIKDYLIKPVNPNQILLSLKKVLDSRKLMDQKTNAGYQQDFRNIAMQFFDDNGHAEWSEIYQKLVYWDRELDRSEDKSMKDVLETQWSEANSNFGRFVSSNYLDWVNESDISKRPLLSPDVLPQSAFKHLDDGYDSVFFLLIDCLRY